MTYRGKVERGIVVLEEGAMLPEGTELTVVPADAGVGEPARGPEVSVWTKMVELARWAESQPCDLPEDLAENHDHYLHGLPKRK